MLTTKRSTTAILRDLGDGLILRRATATDAEVLAAFNAQIHREPPAEQPDEKVAAWTRDLFERPPPNFSASDFTIVEDTRTRAIVSSLNLISQTWSYCGIPFGVGRPELVGTHPDYRNRGLVRAQFEVIHGWSAGRGEIVQAITGIPYYYRQFGYEMGLTLGGGRSGYKPHVPRLKEGETEPYRVRPAAESDLPFIAEMYDRGAQRQPIHCLRDEALWYYELRGRSELNVDRLELRVIESAHTPPEPVGFLAHSPWLWASGGTGLGAVVYELEPGVSWLAVTPSVIRYLWETGEAYAARDGKASDRFAFGLGLEHPVYHAFRDRLPNIRPPYAWYVRVPDLAGFLRHIAPVLERRLAKSVAAGHTGRLKISFYRSGLELVFEAGRLSGVESWRPTPEDGGDAAFPDLTFLRPIFGYQTVDELAGEFADCRAGGDEARALLMALFPKQPSNIWPVD